MNEGQTGNGGGAMAYGGAPMSGGVSAGGSPVGGANPVMPGEAVNSAMTGSGANPMTHTGAPMVGNPNMMMGGQAPMMAGQNIVAGQNPMNNQGMMAGQNNMMMTGQGQMASVGSMGQQNPMMASGPTVGGMTGVGGYTGEPISSGTGDIIIDNGNSGKSKKWLVIGGIVAVVLVGVIVGVVIWIVPRMSGVSHEVRDSFNRFGNYVLYGKDEDSIISGEYSAVGNYYFESHQRTKEEQSALFDKVSMLLNDFMTRYTSNNNEDLSRLIEDENDLFEFMQIVYTKKVYKNNAIVDMYVNEGGDEVIKLANSYYDFSRAEKNGYLKAFKEAFQLWIKSEVGLLDVYNAVGCLDGLRMDENCLSEKGSNEQKAKIAENKMVVDEKWTVLYGFYNMSDDFVENVFEINDLMNGRKSAMLVRSGNED